MGATRVYSRNGENIALKLRRCLPFRIHFLPQLELVRTVGGTGHQLAARTGNFGKKGEIFVTILRLDCVWQAAPQPPLYAVWAIARTDTEGEPPSQRLGRVTVRRLPFASATRIGD